MAILVNLDVMMAKRKMGLTELSDKVGITLANLSILKNNKARAIRFSTLTQSARHSTASRGISWNLQMNEPSAGAAEAAGGRLFQTGFRQRRRRMFIGTVEIRGRAALAPMAGVADRAFRRICADFGAAYVGGNGQLQRALLRR